MIKLYSDADYWDAVLQRRKILAVFVAVTALFCAVLIGFIVWYLLLPYHDPAAPWIIAGTSVATACYMFFSFPFMGIKFKRSNAYCKMLKFISVGLKEYAFLPFLEIDDWTTHDGVDVNVAVFAIRNVKREEEMRRRIFIDGEKDFPDFKEGEHVRMISQGNLLIEYELAERSE